MNNDPASIVAALRTLAVYAVCVVLAIVIGVLMTNPLTYSSLGFVGFLCAVLFLPILLKWHHPLMIFCWNTPIVLFFVKGGPKLALALIMISLCFSIMERALNQRRFINVPQIAWPLICMIGVVIITAKLTGGIGLKAFGSDVYGGKKYVWLIIGILGYFALVARPIPPERARLYVTLYFGVGAISFIGDFYSITPGFLHPIYWVIPPSAIYEPGSFDLGTTRLQNTGWAAVAAIDAMIVYYGLRGIFISGKLWRPIAFFICGVLIFFGGFRSALILTGATIILQFFLEGLHRTRVMPFFVIGVLACMAAVIPLGSKLPHTFQRTLAFVPESWIHLSPDARLDAQGSLDWRLDMWRALLPQIPKHLLLGKGYAISMDDYAIMGQDSAFKNGADAGDQALALSSDYHNGPLSVILPFGIWGAIAFLWFLFSGLWVMYRNYRYGNPGLQTINTFLFTLYVIGTIDFLFLFGGLADGMAGFTGSLGLSVCLNGGVCRAPVRPTQNIPFNIPFLRRRLTPQPAFKDERTAPRTF